MEVKWASSDWVASSECWLGYGLKWESLLWVGFVVSGWICFNEVGSVEVVLGLRVL